MDAKHKKESPNILVIVLFWIIVILSGIYVRNTLEIQKVTEERTETYVTDITGQIADSINFRVEQSIQAMRMIRNSATLFSPDRVETFLEGKRSYFDFDVFYLAKDTTDAETWIHSIYPEAEIKLEGRAGEVQLIAVPAEGSLVYFVSGEADETPGILVGIKKSDALMELMQNDSLDGKGRLFTISGDGTVINTLVQTNFFDIIEEKKEQLSEENKKIFSQMEQAVKTGGEGGMIEYRTIAGEDQILCYLPLNYSDWYVVAFIESDIISAGVDAITMRNILLALAAVGLMGIVMLITTWRQKNIQGKLEHLAYVDPVTGGQNLNRFKQQAEKMVEEQAEKYVLVSMDVQDFKLINNVYGVEEGDRTLAYLYRVLEKGLEPGEILARGSADVFYLFLERQEREALIRRLEHVYTEVNRFNEGRDDSYYLELRFGIYEPEAGETDISRMEERANIARKSQNGRSRILFGFYDRNRSREVIEEKELVYSVDNAIANGEFLVYFQPKVNLERMQVAGAEALIRWNHPQRGILAPGLFVPVLEKYRMISRLDMFVFEEVCRTLARWSAEGRELCGISVNISRQHFDAPDFLRTCKELCSRYGVSPELIELELTETIFLENPQEVKSSIDRIHAAGFRCSLDDFGTGYSSLGLLNDLNVDVIKLDRVFFIGANDNQRGRNIVETILRLAEQLHIDTVAEGIDSPAQAEYLRRSVCGMIQGYVFFKPMPVEEFEREAYQGMSLRYVSLQAETEREGEIDVDLERKATFDPTREIMTFLYFPEEDQVIFSALFSPVQEGRYVINGARKWFGSSGFVHEEDRPAFLKMLRTDGNEPPWMENTLRFLVGQERYEWLEIYLKRDISSRERANVITGVLTNMGEWQAELDRWKEQASRDALTGLYNRAFFESWVSTSLDSGNLERGALIFIDVDDFKNINDTLGHLAGDEILKGIAQKILGVFRRTDVVARFGGDEYVIFVPSVSRNILVARLEQLCQVFREPYVSGNMTYFVAASIGASYYPDDGRDCRVLLANADKALYEAKRRGKNQYVLYEPGM